MPLVDVHARAELIELCAQILTNPDTDDAGRVLDVIEELCSLRDEPVIDLLTEATVRLLRDHAADPYDHLADRHGWPR